MRARMGADFEPRIGAARKRPGARHAGKKEKGGDCVFLCGKDEPARSGQIISLGRENLADHGSGCGALQRLFHGPERLFGACRMDEKERSRIYPMQGEARPIKRALFARGEILADPDDRRAPPRRPQMRGERQGKTCRGGLIAGSRRHDLVQGAKLEAAGKLAIERGDPERNAPRLAGHAFDAGDFGAQEMQARQVRLRSGHPPSLLRSSFVLIDSCFRGRSQGGLGTLVGVRGLRGRLIQPAGPKGSAGFFCMSGRM